MMKDVQKATFEIDTAPNLKPYFEDGRKPIEHLYAAFTRLSSVHGWNQETICTQDITVGLPFGEQGRFPIFSFQSPLQTSSAEALYILSGVHGEEPPGPEAIANNIDFLGELGQKIPIVMMPLLNPGGRYRGWRYQDSFRGGHEPYTSVTDSEYLLLNLDGSGPRAINPASSVTFSITQHILALHSKYRPLLSIDLHEDEALPSSYIYSQSLLQERDPIAQAILRIYEQCGMVIQQSGETRFHEIIRDGVVVSEADGRPILDGSVDELLAAKYIWQHGKVVEKPHTKTAIVLETPTIGIPLHQRVHVHSEVLRSIEQLWDMAQAMNH